MTEQDHVAHAEEDVRLASEAVHKAKSDLTEARRKAAMPMTDRETKEAELQVAEAGDYLEAMERRLVVAHHNARILMDREAKPVDHEIDAAHQEVKEAEERLAEAKRKAAHREYPKYIEPHESQVVDTNGHISVPMFPDHHIDRDGKVTVLVKDEEHEKEATSAKSDKPAPEAPKLYSAARDPVNDPAGAKNEPMLVTDDPVNDNAAKAAFSHDPVERKAEAEQRDESEHHSDEQHEVVE